MLALNQYYPILTGTNTGLVVRKRVTTMRKGEGWEQKPLCRGFRNVIAGHPFRPSINFPGQKQYFPT